MYIQPIDNQLRFKAVYRDKGARFSDVQERVIKDIENKADANKDFLVKHGACEDTVELYELKGSVQNVNRLSSDIAKRKNQLYIGTYEDGYFFQPEDLIIDKKKQKKEASLSLPLVLGVLAAIFSLMVCSRCAAKTAETVPILKEQIVNPIKGSLQKFSKDTLDLTKQLLK